MRAVTKQGESMSHWLCRMAICRADQVNEVEPADLQETNVDDERVLADTWQKFDRGDPITDGELKELINSAKEGLRYLRARGERFVSYKTILDIETLRGFQSTRKAGRVSALGHFCYVKVSVNGRKVLVPALGFAKGGNVYCFLYQGKIVEISGPGEKSLTPVPEELWQDSWKALVTR